MGCGCNSNFSGNRKQCTCGRNAGGECQCNNRKLNASGRLASNVTTPPINARDVAKPCSCNCSECADNHTGTRCNCGSKKCCDGQRVSGGISGTRKNRGNLRQQVKSNRMKYNAFMGYSNKFPKVNTKKYGISDEHYFEFNSRVGHSTGINRADMEVEF